MLIYRIQGRDGVGFHNSESRFDGAMGNPCGMVCPPVGYDGGLITQHENAWFAFDSDVKYRPNFILSGTVTRFGFTSLCQMRHWFARWDDFTRFGPSSFKVLVYDVPPEYVLTGNYQCVFDSSKARLIKEFGIKREIV